MLTDPNIKGRAQIVKKTEKTGLYTALDVGAVWLERALAGKEDSPNSPKAMPSGCFLSIENTSSRGPPARGDPVDLPAISLVLSSIRGIARR